MLRSVIRILRASLAQIDTEMAEKYAKLGKAAMFRIAYTISEEGIRFRHPDYDPNRAQKLISSSMSRRLSTRNISSKSMHAFLPRDAMYKCGLPSCGVCVCYVRELCQNE